MEQVPAHYLRAQYVFANPEGPDYMDPVIDLEGDPPSGTNAIEEYIDALAAVRQCNQDDSDIRRRVWIETRIRL